MVAPANANFLLPHRTRIRRLVNGITTEVGTGSDLARVFRLRSSKTHKLGNGTNARHSPETAFKEMRTQAKLESPGNR